MKHINPQSWPRPRGYSNGITASGEMVFVAGMIGWNPAGEFQQDFISQLEQTLENTVAVLLEAGAGPADIVRMTWFIKNLDEYRQNLPAVGDVYKRVIGKNFPTMAVIGVNDLVETQALLEIETTAVKRNSD